MGLADQFRSLIETRGVSQSALARRFGMTRARVNQILRLHKLHPAIQDYVRSLSGVGPRYLTERRLRSIGCLSANEQLARLEQLYPDFAKARSDIKSMAG